MKHNYSTASLGLVMLAASTIIISPGSKADVTGDLLLFPHAGAIYHFDLEDPSSLAADDYKFGVDLFATLEQGHFSFLGEALLARDEQEIERLQLGWRVNGSEIWLGRFHNPIGYWNTQFHHGSYLETAISRPAIVDYEEDGLLPMHVIGLLIEGTIERGQQGLGYALAVGAGPRLGDELEALDILEPGSGKHGLSFALDLHYEPMLYAPTRYGLFADYTEIPVVVAGIKEVHQTIAGLYGNRESPPWHLTGSFIYVRNSMEGPSYDRNDDFFSGYFQAEYNLEKHWTLFGRLEWTLGEKNDAYLELFPRHVQDRVLGGIRLDFLERHALKLEISRNRSPTDDYSLIILQWDAMF